MHACMGTGMQCRDMADSHCNLGGHVYTLEGLTCEERGVVHALRAGDDLLAADEHVEGAAVARVLRVRHRVEGARLIRQCTVIMPQVISGTPTCNPSQH